MKLNLLAYSIFTLSSESVLMAASTFFSLLNLEAVVNKHRKVMQLNTPYL